MAPPRAGVSLKLRDGVVWCKQYVMADGLESGSFIGIDEIVFSDSISYTNGPPIRKSPTRNWFKNYVEIRNPTVFLLKLV